MWKLRDVDLKEKIKNLKQKNNKKIKTEDILNNNDSGNVIDNASTDETSKTSDSKLNNRRTIINGIKKEKDKLYKLQQKKSELYMLCSDGKNDLISNECETGYYCDEGICKKESFCLINFDCSSDNICISGHCIEPPDSWEEISKTGYDEQKINLNGNIFRLDFDPDQNHLHHMKMTMLANWWQITDVVSIVEADVGGYFYVATKRKIYRLVADTLLFTIKSYNLPKDEFGRKIHIKKLFYWNGQLFFLSKRGIIYRLDISGEDDEIDFSKIEDLEEIIKINFSENFTKNDLEKISRNIHDEEFYYIDDIQISSDRYVSLKFHRHYVLLNEDADLEDNLIVIDSKNILQDIDLENLTMTNNELKRIILENNDFDHRIYIFNYQIVVFLGKNGHVIINGHFFDALLEKVTEEKNVNEIQYKEIKNYDMYNLYLVDYGGNLWKYLIADNRVTVWRYSNESKNRRKISNNNGSIIVPEIVEKIQITGHNNNEPTIWLISNRKKITM